MRGAFSFFLKIKKGNKMQWKTTTRGRQPMAAVVVAATTVARAVGQWNNKQKNKGGLLFINPATCRP